MVHFVNHVLAALIICLLLMVFRCIYRLLGRCKIHVDCHRNWHQDDVWIAIAIIPLVTRVVCVSYQSDLSRPGHSDADLAIAQKLLIVARLCYASFLWCLKMCLSSFYLRLTARADVLRRVALLLYWSMVVTFAVVVLSTLLECRPLSLYWKIDHVDPPTCQKGNVNLLAMAILNIFTDLVLIIFPLPLLWRMSLSRTKKLQLTAVFSVGICVVGITIARLVLILDDNSKQSVRSLWASIEMITACVVANVGFFYSVIRAIKNEHMNSSIVQISTTASHQQQRTLNEVDKNISTQHLCIVGEDSSIRLVKFNV